MHCGDIAALTLRYARQTTLELITPRVSFEDCAF